MNILAESETRFSAPTFPDLHQKRKKEDEKNGEDEEEEEDDEDMKEASPVCFAIVTISSPKVLCVLHN